MPYALEKSGRGYYVITKETLRKHSNRPLPKKRAMAQMRALYASEQGYTLRSVRRSKKRAINKIHSIRGGHRSVCR
jgi:hypothetical protein